tara:strand:- start:2000 stop:2176 length:177 start_codon:yes stop_codon:yes gene_type:complete
MTEMIAQVFGLTFVSIILVCLVWSIIEYVVLGVGPRPDKNSKLLDNIEKLERKMKEQR